MADNSKKFALRVTILDDLQRMEADELEVVKMFTAGMVTGLKVYGHLDIDTDPRNFLAEAQEEGRDRLVYMIIDHLKLERLSKKRR